MRISEYTHEGLTFDVTDTGPEDGPPVVLLHGFPERRTGWRRLAPLLHEAGLRTLAPDQRGYSPRARPARRSDYKARHLIGDVVALVDRVGGPVHLVGHDWGAAVSWLVAARRPDLVRTLTAVSVPHPAAFVHAARTSSQGLRSWYMAAFQLPRLPELLAARPGGVFDRALRRSGMTPDELARFRAEVVDDDALPGALGWYRAMPLPDQGGSGRAVQVPTTFVWSDGDVAIGRRGVEECARFVAAPYELVVLEGVSHWIPTQAPEQLADAVLRRIQGAEVSG